MSTNVEPSLSNSFRSAFAHASIGMAILDAAGGVGYVNQALCRIRGYAEDELRQMKFGTLVHPDDWASRLEVFQQMLAGAARSDIGEWRLLRKGGSAVWVRVRATVPSEQAGGLEIIALVEDISER